MKCAGHLTLHTLYVGVCKIVASGMLCRLFGSSSSDIGSSASQIVSSIGDGASDMTRVSGLNSVGNEKSTMIQKYRGSLPIHPY